MRKYIKDQLLSILASMEEAEKEIERLYKETLKESVETILMDLQQVAIAVGTEVEKSEGEGLEIVRFLEDYCELLWQCSQCKVIKDQLKYCKLLNETRIKIQWALKNDIKEQYDIVFMPYKASMWDSMESIWQAAYEDERCNCYVMPIPYFDKKSDGTIGEMHYEGKELPEYVSTVDYRNFDLIQMHPDVIYIHNPYDQSNYITSVHPNFYSSELKKATDMLVYIPYFVSCKEVPRHLCLLPGIINADRVILQSEDVRKVYIEEYINAFPEEYREQAIIKANGKFLGIGSPKFDKVSITAKESVIMPKEWEKLVIKSNGKRKKVVLYNITIDSFLKKKDKMIKKIESVLKTFEKLEDTVLLWRPHPLIKATLQSMCPEILEVYEKVETKYKDSGWGIYDDTADLNRAIAMSDAYYGDMSSVVVLYELTGKPIMIQDIDNLNC